MEPWNSTALWSPWTFPSNSGMFNSSFTHRSPPSSSHHGEQLRLFEIVIFALIFAVISAAGIIGNGLVIVAIAGDSKMRKSTMNALLLNLAAADLSNVITCIPQFIFQIWNLGWLMPNELCPMLRFAERVFLYTSLLTQLAVGIERFYAIAYPMKVHLLCSRRKVIWWSIFLWMAAMAASSPYAVWSEIRLITSTQQALCIWGGGLSPGTKVTLRAAECVVFYFVPLVLIVVLYSFVSARLWSRDQQLHEGRSDHGASETLKTRRDVVKMLIVCICVYFVCYSPIQAIVVSTVLFGKQVRFGMSAALAMHFLAYSCSAANPIVYTLYSHRFRRKFAQLLCCCRRNYERIAGPGHQSNNCNNNTSSWNSGGGGGNPYGTNGTSANSPRQNAGKSSLGAVPNTADTCELTSSLLVVNPGAKSPSVTSSPRRAGGGSSFKKYNSSPSLNSTNFGMTTNGGGGRKKAVLCVNQGVLRKLDNM